LDLKTLPSIYIGIQESVARKHIAKWISKAEEEKKSQPIMMTARFLNMDTSLKVFCGDHLPEEAVIEISDKYWLITQALELVNFPFALPGTKVYKAIQARKIAMRWLELAAKRSKVAMAEGKAPSCMVDEWVSTLNDPSYKGRKEFSDREMAMVVLSFLFASQDAMSSGLIYAFQHVADHPEIAKKIREEQERVRHGNYDAPLTLDMMDEMVYLNAVVKESMRVKPPVVMVCHSVS
jgi:sterol 22-desaturase